MKLDRRQNSPLRLKNLYVDNFSFERLGTSSSHLEPEIEIDRHIESVDGCYLVSLIMNLVCAEEYSLSITISGLFQCELDDPIKNILIEKNTVAILFPYLRSQVTLLTSQPSLKPIVLPPININALLSAKQNQQP